MRICHFTLEGNQENIVGNPIPYHRTTQKSFWDKASKRYKAWKDFVCQQYWLQVMNCLKNEKPFGKDFSGRVEVFISFSLENHADPDNVGKGIIDSLFKNDKHVNLTTNFSCHNPVGLVEVFIYENM